MCVANNYDSWTCYTACKGFVNALSSIVRCNYVTLVDVGLNGISFLSGNIPFLTYWGHVSNIKLLSALIILMNKIRCLAHPFTTEISTPSSLKFPPLLSLKFTEVYNLRLIIFSFLLH